MNKNNESNHPRNKNHSQVDWDRVDEIWYVAGFGTVQLNESIIAGDGTPNWTDEEMDEVFFNKAKVQTEYSFPIKWDAFDQKYGEEVYRMGRDQLLAAILAFSRDENSIKATAEFYDDIDNRLGVRLAMNGDDWTSIFPDFYYERAMTAEDFFFDHFIGTKLPYSVYDPVKFAAWVLSDHRWQALVTLYSI
jgi:hypothetical protein